MRSNALLEFDLYISEEDSPLNLGTGLSWDRVPLRDYPFYAVHSGKLALAAIAFIPLGSYPEVFVNAFGINPEYSDTDLAAILTDNFETEMRERGIRTIKILCHPDRVYFWKSLGYLPPALSSQENPSNRMGAISLSKRLSGPAGI